MPRTAILSLFAGLIAIAGIVGCGSGDDPEKLKRPKVAPAEGIVTYQGNPVEGATIVFSPTTGTNAASALTDSRGRFAMSAFPPDPGAVPGNYNVAITKTEQTAGPAGGHDEAPAAPAAKSLLPEKYGKAESSGLTAEIPESGKTDLKFELVD